MKNRSIFLVTLCFIGITIQLQAQKIGGIRAGWQNAVLVSDGDAADALQSFYVGLYRNNKFGGIFAISTGIEYFQNGTELDANNYAKLHYISVPLGFRVKLGPVFAIAGPALNFKVAEKQRLAGLEIPVTDENKAAFFDLPVFLGAGVKIFMFTIEARYHWGLLDVYDGTKNQYFQLGAGLSF